MRLSEPNGSNPVSEIKKFAREGASNFIACPVSRSPHPPNSSIGHYFKVDQKELGLYSRQSDNRGPYRIKTLVREESQLHTCAWP